MSSIFISYSRKDEEFARRLAASLEEMGADVWLDVDDIPSGQKWSTAIQQGLDSAEIMLVILSPDSMASVNVEDEWQYFLDTKKPIIPLLLREAKIHFQLNRIQWVNFLQQPYERALNELHQELNKKGVKVRSPAAVTAVSYSRSDVQQYAESAQAELTAVKPRLPLQLIFGVGVGVLAVLMVMVVIFLAGRNPITPVDTPATQVAANGQATQSTAPTATTAPTQTPTEAAFVLSAVHNNADWDVIERNINGVPMVLVPPGTFILGATNEQLSNNRAECNRMFSDCSFLNDEQPTAPLTIANGFWLDKWEVTNAIYNGSGNNLPKVNVDWNEAAAHCATRDARLPSEVEWEYAASGPDNWNYPWGNTWDTSRNLANICDRNCDSGWRDSQIDDGYAAVAPVGSYPAGASWVGALDMVGNVWEYTGSVYAAYPYHAATTENNAYSTASHTLRGGGYVWIRGEATTSARAPFAPGVGSRSAFYGFRCARLYQAGDLENY